MRAVVWSRAAQRNLAALRLYLEAEAGMGVAARTADRLEAAAAALADFAHVGRPAGRRARQLTTVRPYLIRCRVQARTVLIIGVRHGARRPLG